MIATALVYLEQAASGEALSTFHLLAGIAACHANAKTFAETNWRQILSYYDALAQSDHSPIVLLNRAVASSFVDGPAVALEALQKLRKNAALDGYYLLPATIADLLRRLDRPEKALEYYLQALTLVKNEPEKRFLMRRVEQCRTNKK